MDTTCAVQRGSGKRIQFASKEKFLQTKQFYLALYQKKKTVPFHNELYLTTFFNKDIR